MINELKEPPHYLDFNNWDRIPDSEIDRLQGTLNPHLKKINIKKSKENRVIFVKNLLDIQNYTCALSNCNGKYCWNEPKENWTKEKAREVRQQKILPYIKLQWGHIKPRCRGTAQSIEVLCLMCARCNNQIQTSRNFN